MGQQELILLAGPGDFLKRISVATPVPRHIGWSDVEHIRSTTRAVATAENVFGGGLSCEAAIAQLRWAGKLLDVRTADNVRRSMVEAIGNLSSVVAYSAFDVLDYDAADQCFHFALWCADESGSWALRANTLAEMSRKAVYLHDLDNAATGEVEENPPWLTYYDKAEHQGSIGKALMPVARAERNFDIAAPRLREAIALHRKTYPRSRAFSRTRLATLAMEMGDPHEAVNLGRELLDEVSTLRSDRISRELHDLAYATRRHANIGDVNDLRHDLLALTPTKPDQ